MGAALDYYYNKSKIWLPMKAENHDPSNASGVNILTDGDMESATIDDWVTFNSTNTKSTASPHSGSQALRMTFLSDTDPQMRLTPNLPTGVKYDVRGWARGDGTVKPWLSKNGSTGANAWVGTTSTAWQYFEILGYVGGGTLRLYLDGSSGWVEWDDITIEPLESRTLDVSGNANHALLGDWHTPTTMPTKLQKRGYSFDGSDYLYTPWAPTPAGTMTVFFRGNTAGGLMGSYYATTGADRCYLWLNGGHLNGGIANQNLTIIAGTTSLNTDQWYFGAITWDGSTVVLVLDDNIEYTAAQVGAVPNTYPIAVGAVAGTFAPTTYHAGDVAQAVAFDWALSMPQLQDLKTLMYKQVNHV